MPISSLMSSQLSQAMTRGLAFVLAWAAALFKMIQ